MLTTPRNPDRRRRGRLCTCKAYPWHIDRGGGLCRWPEPPAQVWSGKPGKSKATGARSDRGVRARIARQLGWHPIRDRAYIRRWLVKLYVAYCRRCGFENADVWLGYHGCAGIPATRVTAEGYDSSVPPFKAEDDKGHAHPLVLRGAERVPDGNGNCAHDERARNRAAADRASPGDAITG